MKFIHSTYVGCSNLLIIFGWLHCGWRFISMWMFNLLLETFLFMRKLVACRTVAKF